MRVVVVGATGNVGSSVVEALARDENVTEIVGLARRLPNWTVEKTRFAAADIAADDLVAHFRGASAVVHLAWLFQPTHRPLVTWRTNVEGSGARPRSCQGGRRRFGRIRLVGRCVLPWRRPSR
jgi:UDP-glucose 4-epimerase